MFAVTPLAWCPHLESIVTLEGSLDTSALCETCSTPRENWVCLTCHHVHCGRYINKHMLEHSEGSGHNVVLSYADLSVWCFTCDSYVYNPVSSIQSLKISISSLSVSSFLSLYSFQRFSFHSLNWQVMTSSNRNGFYNSVCMCVCGFICVKLFLLLKNFF